MRLTGARFTRLFHSASTSFLKYVASSRHSRSSVRHEAQYFDVPVHVLFNKLPSVLLTFRDGCSLSLDMCFAIFTTISELDGDRVALSNIFLASITIRPSVLVAWLTRYMSSCFCSSFPPIANLCIYSMSRILWRNCYREKIIARYYLS